MSTVLWTVRTPSGGQVSITPRPDYPADLPALRAAGVDVLVSALTPDENEVLDLVDEGLVAEQAGIRFRALPIADMSVPVDLGAFLPALHELAASVDAGEHVAVHCFASRGRSGIITILLLTLCGWAPEAAMERMSELRGHRVPETDQQRAWVLQTAESLVTSNGAGS